MVCSLSRAHWHVSRASIPPPSAGDACCVNSPGIAGPPQTAKTQRYCTRASRFARSVMPERSLRDPQARRHSKRSGKKPGVVVAEAELKPAQVQDLADQVGELARVAVGHEVRLRLRIEVGGGRS